MHEKSHPPFGIRDAFWLLVVCLVLAAWGWDRGRLAASLESLSQSPAAQAATTADFEALVDLIVSTVTASNDIVDVEAEMPFAP